MGKSTIGKMWAQVKSTLTSFECIYYFIWLIDISPLWKIFRAHPGATETAQSCSTAMIAGLETLWKKQSLMLSTWRPASINIGMQQLQRPNVKLCPTTNGKRNNFKMAESCWLNSLKALTKVGKLVQGDCKSNKDYWWLCIENSS